MKKESAVILKILLETKTIDLDKLSLLVRKNKKQMWYELSVLNQYLVDCDLSPIEIKNGVLVIPEAEVNEWKTILVREKMDGFRLQQERIFILILYIACRQEFVSTYHLQDLVGLSRNSVMIDIRKLRKLINHYDVALHYDRKNGYKFTGNELKIRKLMEYALSKLNEVVPLDKVTTFFEEIWHVSFKIGELNDEILNLAKHYQLEFVMDRLEEFVYFFAFMKMRRKETPIPFAEHDKEILSQQRLYPMAVSLVKDIYHSKRYDEILFWETRLLSIIQGDKGDSKDNYFTQLTTSIIQNVQTMIGIKYKNVELIERTLYQHIVPAYFRIKFDVYYKNPLLDKIKTEYRDLFHLTKKGLQPLADELNKSISDNEIAYFTIHFGGYLYSNQEREKQKLRALAVCPNGISSSLIMNASLKSIFPEIEFVQEHSLNRAKMLPEDEYDIIFSTTFFPANKKLYLTKPILNPVEREVLREKVCADFDLLDRQKSIDLKKLIAIVERHGTIQYKDRLYTDLQAYLYGVGTDAYKGAKNLPDLLNETLIRVSSARMNWKEAIREAARPLLEQHYINESYIQAMIKSVEKIGPYIVLAPKVAVPHARPEEGVKKLGISLLKLDHPVDFNSEGEDDPERFVQLVFVLAAVDGQAHLSALVQLSKILDDEENIEQLIKLKEPLKIYQLIKQLVEQEGGTEHD
ncbi:BglG family transcription antiterminator [Amphibacillus sediminis]|uniref:BglG family transcription antiterminator n=1 Tax=Amphibacillus sediminis TaxID=360185 RepID=UPI000831F8F4|nr:BglG family transcription antiterminator [Amphibacillus sediminis]